MPKRPLKKALTLALLAPLLVSCGDKKEYTGQFIDAPVEGLRYSTDSQDGLTNENGEFTYRRQETVEFYLGNYSLGRSNVQSVVTPLDLADTDSYENFRVINIARLLQTLDSNQGKDGIQISEEARNESGRLDGVNLDSDPTKFEADSRLTDYIATVTTRTTLIDKTEAITALKSGIGTTDDTASDFDITIGDISSPVTVTTNYKIIYLSATLESGISASTVKWSIDEIKPDESGITASIDNEDTLNDATLTIYPYTPADGLDKVMKIRVDVTASDGKKAHQTKQLTICGIPNC